MTTSSRHATGQTTTGASARTMPTGSAVMAVVVRVAGIVPARLDLTHAGTNEQQLGLSVGTVLIYLRSGITARAVADGWARAAVLARPLSPAVTGRRPLVIGRATVAVMVQLAGVPQVTAEFHPARAAGAVPAMLRVQVGPLTWEVCDATAYASLLRAWRQAARLLGDDTGDHEDD